MPREILYDPRELDNLNPDYIRDREPVVTFTDDEFNYIVEKYDLTEKQEKILYLISVDGLTQEEAAKEMGISQQMVSKQVEFVCKKLRKCAD